jgi:hypothetical protein
MMLFVNAHPQIKVAGETEVEHKKPVHRQNSVYKNLELAPEPVEAHIDLVNFRNSDIEYVMHQPLIFFSIAVVE